MTVPTVFDLCTPRQDVRDGSISDSDFAANLSRVLRGDATADYADPMQFFANTYPTEGLKELLSNVCRRLSGQGQAISAVFRLDTSFGGGKTPVFDNLRKVHQVVQVMRIDLHVIVPLIEQSIARQWLAPRKCVPIIAPCSKNDAIPHFSR